MDHVLLDPWRLTGLSGSAKRCPAAPNTVGTGLLGHFSLQVPVKIETELKSSGVHEVNQDSLSLEELLTAMHMGFWALGGGHALACSSLCVN